MQVYCFIVKYFRNFNQGFLLCFVCWLFKHALKQQENTSYNRQTMGYCICKSCNQFIYLGLYVAFNTLQVISRWVVGSTEETSTYSSSGLCTVNCRPTASNCQLSHLRSGREPKPRSQRWEARCYHSATMAPSHAINQSSNIMKFSRTLNALISQIRH